MTRLSFALLLCCQVFFIPAFGEVKFTNELKWQQLSDLPPAPGQDVQPGLAAPFVGVSGNVLLIAGGCNNKYQNHAYALEQNADDGYTWHTGFKIPQQAAYGVSITVPEGVICIGGNNNNESFSAVFLMIWDPGSMQIKTESLPSLPFSMSKMAGALVDQKIFLAGGYTDGRTG